jgi:hypothetical protein
MKQRIDQSLHSLRQLDERLQLFQAGFIQFVGVIFYQEV